MADQIGELGLDVSEIKKSIDSGISSLDNLTGAVDRTDKKIKTGLVGTLKEAAKVFGIAFGAQAVTRYIYNLRNLSNEIDQMRAKMGADAVGEGGAAFGFHRAGIALDKFVVKAKIATAEAFSGLQQIGERVGDSFTTVLSKVFTGHLNESGPTTEVSRQAAEDRKADAIRRQLIEDESKLAETRGKSLNTQKDQLILLNDEIGLRQKRLDLVKANRDNFDNPQEIINAETAALGALRAQREAVEFAQKQELHTAEQLTIQMDLQQKGQSGAAKEAAIRSKYEREIAAALREGKDSLAAQLRSQRDIELNRIRVEEHNLTNAQRREERTGARKFARDTAKAAAHEIDLESRLRQAEREGHRITPGSELDRYRNRARNAAAANAAAERGDVRVHDSPLAAKSYGATIRMLPEISKKLDSAFQNK